MEQKRPHIELSEVGTIHLIKHNVLDFCEIDFLNFVWKRDFNIQ